jgi:ribosomal protein L29
MTEQELDSKEIELIETLAVLRLRHKTNQLESTARLQETRRDLARLKTIRRQRTAVAKEA